MSQALITALRDELGSGILVGNDIPARNQRDWASQAPVRPLAVARPKSPEGVASVLRICSAYEAPVVPQGGLTGLCGGAQPVEGCVVLSLERLVGIEEVDAVANAMTVLAGTTLEPVQMAAARAGRFFGLDLGSRGSCTIGGNLSTNAGGNRVLRYGMAREMVLGIEAVLPDGTLMRSLNKMLKNNAGYDLKQLFIGSEGTLGVIARAVLRLLPLPASTCTAMCGLADYGAVLKLLGSAERALGPQLSAFEVMWQDFFDTATDRVPGIRRPFESRYPFCVLLEAQGNDATSDPVRFEAWLGDQLETKVIADAVIAQSRSDEESLWALRDAVSEFQSFTGPLASFDIGLPLEQIDTYAQTCRAALSRELPDCESFFFGHIADGNIHVLTCAPRSEKLPTHQIEEIVYGLVRQFGGTVSAEHGIGLTKMPYLAYCRTPEELTLMRMLKNTIDPKGILNPGKFL